MTCAVFLAQLCVQGSSVYLVVQKLCGAGWQISSWLLICVFINCHILAELKLWHFFLHPLYSLHLLKSYLSDLLTNCLQLSAQEVTWVWFCLLKRVIQLRNRKLLSLWNTENPWLGTPLSPVGLCYAQGPVESDQAEHCRDRELGSYTSQHCEHKLPSPIPWFPVQASCRLLLCSHWTLRLCPSAWTVPPAAAAPLPIVPVGAALR